MGREQNDTLTAVPGHRTKAIKDSAAASVQRPGTLIGPLNMAGQVRR